MLHLEIVTDTTDQLGSRQQSSGFHNSPFSGHSSGFNGSEPWALDGSGTDQEPDSSSLLRLSMVCKNPMPYFLAAMPGGMVPDQYEHALALAGQTLTEPGEKGGRHVADRPPVRHITPPFCFGSERDCCPSVRQPITKEIDAWLKTSPALEAAGARADRSGS
jgi:hypothetical protein